MGEKWIGNLSLRFLQYQKPKSVMEKCYRVVFVLQSKKRRKEKKKMKSAIGKLPIQSLKTIFLSARFKHGNLLRREYVHQFSTGSR